MNSREQLLSRITSEIERYINEEVEREVEREVKRRTKKHLSDKNPNEPDLPQAIDILTAEEISKYLGVSRATIYELFKVNVEYGGIPNFKIGNSRRVDKRDLIKWIEDRKKEHNEQFQK
ncbi:helix-turn-helix domain-containing protein [Paenibacillus glucanolyticus]